MTEQSKLLAIDLDVLERNSHLPDAMLSAQLLDLGAWFLDLRRVCASRGLSDLHKNRPDLDRYVTGPLANLSEELSYEQLAVILCEVADRGVKDHVPTSDGRDNPNLVRARVVIQRLLATLKTKP